MRICHVAMGDLWAGAEVHLLALAEGLRREPDIETTIVLFNDGRLADELRALGLPVNVFAEREVNAMGVLRGLVTLCRTSRFDILHTHKYKDIILGTLAAIRTGVPGVVRTVHGLSEPLAGAQALRMRGYEYLESVAINRRTDHLIAVSAQIAAVLRARYRRTPVTEVHNGIPLPPLRSVRERKAVVSTLGIDPGRRIVGTAGRLTAVKGHVHFLHAARLMLQTRRDLHFVVAGDGPLRTELLVLARSLGIEDHVSFLGHRDDVQDLISAMDVFVLPSLHEGVPMVLLEALALGTPVVASRVGGIPEVLRDREEGVLIPSCDPPAIALATHQLLLDGVMGERYRSAGRRRVEESFSAASMCREVAAVYREVALAKHFSTRGST